MLRYIPLQETIQKPHRGPATGRISAPPKSEIRDLKCSGFSLIELLTASAVLVLMVVLLTSMFSSLTTSTSRSGQMLDIDLTARQALDRIGRDFAMMPLNQGLDYSLTKQDGNDEFSFFSRVPGVLPGGGDGSGLTLVTYRVNDGNLERRAVAQTFDDLNFLTYNTAGAIVANTGITKALTAAGSDAVAFHILAENVFRFELGFLLKSGAYNPLPLDLTQNPAQNTMPGFRRWTTRPIGDFAEVTTSTGPNNVAWRHLGWQDVQAIVVNIVAIDKKNAGRMTDAELTSLADNFPDATASPAASLELTGTAWQTILANPAGLGIPVAVANGIRAYQRAFNLNSPTP
jgi:type II secretory pathway component PulJ